MMEYEKICSNKIKYQECVEHITSETKQITSNVLYKISNLMQDVEVIYEVLIQVNI